MRRINCILAMTLLALASAAQATLVTIDADDYAPGTVIGPTADAAISYLNHNRGDDFFTYRAAISAIEPTCITYTTCAAPTGTHVLSDGTRIDGVLQPSGTVGLDNMFFGLSPADDPDRGPGQGIKLDAATISLMHDFHAMRIDFAAPTNYFSADFFGVTDPAVVFAFARDGSYLSFSPGVADLKRVFFGPGCTSQGCDTWQSSAAVQHDIRDISFVIVGSMDSIKYMDAIRFDVPEPGTLSLFAIGLLAMLRTGRIRRQLIRH